MEDLRLYVLMVDCRSGLGRTAVEHCTSKGIGVPSRCVVSVNQAVDRDLPIETSTREIKLHPEINEDTDIRMQKAKQKSSTPAV